MKLYKYFLITFFLTVLFSKDEVLENLTYNQTQDISYTKKIKNYTKFNSYTSKDGTILNLGDTLIVGKPSTDDSQYKEYSGTRKVFSFIMIGGVGINALSGPNFLSATSQADKLTIEKIWVSHTKLSKKSPLIVFVTVRDPNIDKIANKFTISNIEKAIQLGEIISPNRPMNRQEAIAKLKESKDLLDLGIINQQEYDKLKAELTPIITKK